MSDMTVTNPFALGSPAGSDGKESACNAGDMGSIPQSGRSPGEGNGSSLQYSCLENFMGRAASWAISPWGCKESDTDRATNSPPPNAISFH